MEKQQVTGEQQVTAHLKKLDPEIGEAVEALRQIVLSAHAEIGEHVKWNNPAYYYTGQMQPFDPKEYRRDIAVFNLHKNRIMLVFPTGAKVNDTSGLLEGDYKDGRRLITFKDIDDVKARKTALQNVIKQWIALVDK